MPRARTICHIVSFRGCIMMTLYLSHNLCLHNHSYGVPKPSKCSHFIPLSTLLFPGNGVPSLKKCPKISSELQHGGFSKEGNPLNHSLINMFSNKLTIFGYPHFKKPPHRLARKLLGYGISQVSRIPRAPLPFVTVNPSSTRGGVTASSTSCTAPPLPRLKNAWIRQMRYHTWYDRQTTYTNDELWPTPSPCGDCVWSHSHPQQCSRIAI